MEIFNRNLRLSTNEYLFIQSVNYIHKNLDGRNKPYQHRANIN